MSFLALCDRLGTLNRQISSIGGQGQNTKTFAPALLNIPIAVISLSGTVINEYALRQQKVSHKIITTINLDTATMLPGEPFGGSVLGGCKLGDQWLDSLGNLYLVQDYMTKLNTVITMEGQYISVVNIIRP